MQLPALQLELEARFGQIAKEREEHQRIFALEHGLQIDTSALASELSKQLRYGALNNSCWLAWIVFATEVGYDYAGAEYWQTFKERLPGWSEIDNNKNRSRIRMWFRRFASTYHGVRPSGTWAGQFRIIAWPITHAVLPRDLQYQFAKSLHYNRFQIAADNDPLAIGQLMHQRAVHASSRFREFCEQEELVGRIALALLGVETGDLPLTPETTHRIVSDLETMQEAREWLKEARADIRRIRGARRQRAGERAPQERVSPTAQPRFNLRPSLLLSQENSAWRVAIQMPSFAPLAAVSPDVAQYLRKTKVRFNGGSGQWHPAQILAIPSKLHALIHWPDDGTVLQFKDSFPPFEQLVRQEVVLNPGPLWVCKIGNDRIAREVRSQQMRPSSKYLVLARAGFAFAPIPGFEPVELRCEGLTGVQFSLPERVSDELRHAIKALGLSFASTVRIWPAGLPAVSWDGEGQSEWLTTDTPCFGIDVDHEATSFEVALDDVSTLQIPRAGVQGPSWVQLPPLSLGRHRLVVEVKNSAGHGRWSGASCGEVILEVRDPLGLEESIHQRGGLMVIATPTDATLEHLERGELRLDAFGPTGREVQLYIEIEGSQSVRKPFEKVVLPATLTDLWNRLPVDIQEDLGGSSACRLLISAGEIGTYALALERESRPLRWQLRRFRHATSIRLVDEAGLGSHVLCQMGLLDQPATARVLDYDDCVDGFDVDSPGALFVVAGRDRLDAVIVSQPGQGNLHGLAQLAPAPRLDGFATTVERVPSDVELLTLWSRARVVGPLSAARQSKVVRSMRDALVGLVCGTRWMQAEHMYEQSARDDDAKEVLGDAISARREWRSFPAKLRMSHKETLEMNLSHVVHWLLAITKGFRICDDALLVERALRYLTDPNKFIGWSRNATEEVLALASNGEMTRGVRYLQLLLEDKSWDWN